MIKNYITTGILIFLLLFNFSFSDAQTIIYNTEENGIKGCTLPVSNKINISYTPPSEFVKERLANRANPCSTIEVIYNGFPTDIFGGPGEAQLAFQFAVDIWETLLDSPVTITIDATFAPAALGNLGSAGPEFYATVPGQGPNTLYPAALAEKLIGSELNGTNSVDIGCNFNSNVDWYFGTDGNAGTQIDFVSVVLHELGHGLGITGFHFVNNNLGYVRREPSGLSIALDGSSQFNSIWDSFIDAGDIFGNPISILNATNFPEASDLMLVAFTSDNLTCNSPLATAQNGGDAPKTFAPSTYSGGSSYSHWDENTFNGTSNALMTPILDNGEAIHDPGNITLGFMEDMGWSLCQGSLSTNDFTLEDIKVSPNPFVNSITINLPSTLSIEEFDISIIDINGRKILKQTTDIINGKIEISNLANLKTALYFLNIESKTSDLRITKKIIKQ
ncbi:T9SS type A sorting domain-containing protein [uncultured Winogradskyella sp.]|uniref:T9SS type A sorting domain-containing protein n=1 Tax=uncultured Winogradskyella sp. TaxID=395353 RepID=UPI0026138977|nr:T9SS type A sorting domain-containing protein [uncultured Winogradskyella sp.]